MGLNLSFSNGYPSVSTAVMCAKASMLIQFVLPDLLLMFLSLSPTAGTELAHRERIVWRGEGFPLRFPVLLNPLVSRGGLYEDYLQKISAACAAKQINSEQVHPVSHGHNIQSSGREKGQDVALIDHVRVMEGICESLLTLPKEVKSLRGHIFKLETTVWFVPTYFLLQVITLKRDDGLQDDRLKKSVQKEELLQESEDEPDNKDNTTARKDLGDEFCSDVDEDSPDFFKPSIPISDLDNSTNNVLIPLDSLTSELLVYRFSLSISGNKLKETIVERIKGSLVMFIVQVWDVLEEILSLVWEFASDDQYLVVKVIRVEGSSDEEIIQKSEVFLS
ncbi:hypothetical protein Tco_0090269 [Tanacetum coccineum]